MVHGLISQQDFCDDRELVAEHVEFSVVGVNRHWYWKMLQDRWKRHVHFNDNIAVPRNMISISFREVW